MSVADRDKDEAVPIIKQFAAAGYRLFGTAGTAHLIRTLGLPVRQVGKIAEGDRTIVELIRTGEVGLVVNTVSGGRGVLMDGFDIRRAAVEARIPCLTSLDTAGALAVSIAHGGSDFEVLPVTDYGTAR
jgi:carbamoyl-phosphate synthase large subunit